MSEQKALTMGTVIEDRYRLISEGSPRDIGVAYRAHDLQGDRLVDLVVVAARWGGGQEALPGLQRAKQTIANLSVPGLLPYEHAGVVDGQLALVYPDTGGQTLANLLAESGRLEEKTAVAIAIRLCEVLAPAHQAGLTHGSLAPQCIVLKGTATPDDPAGAGIVVLDTGLLPALRSSGTSEERPWGRFPYISPEQAAGQGVQPPSDVYAIGEILYEMLIGRPPFRATEEAVLALQHLHQEPPSLQIMDTSIPKPLAQIVYRTLAKEPSARYRNAGQLAHILRAQVGPRPEPVRPAQQEPLVVPPPPAPVISDPWASTDLYDVEGAADVDRAAEGVDWLMIALLVAALIAVLGLIPLWHAVYNRYAGVATSSSTMPYQSQAGPAPILLDGHHQGSQSARPMKLGEPVVVWYNGVPSRLCLARVGATSRHARDLINCREKAPGFGVQLTGRGEKA